MTNVEVRIISGQLSTVQGHINKAMRDGWHLMGAATYAGVRNTGDIAGIPHIRIFYTATIWKQREAAEESDAD